MQAGDIFLETLKIRLSINYSGVDADFTDRQLSLDLTLADVMFSIWSSFGYYKYEIKKFTLAKVVQTFPLDRGYKVDPEYMIQNFNNKSEQMIKVINSQGKVDRKLHLSEIFGNNMDYPKFWNNFIS